MQKFSLVETPMRLDQYHSGSYSPGAPLWKQVLWYYIGEPLFRSRLLPSSNLKAQILRAFGAQVGQGVVIKPGVRVKFPWKLSVGAHSWIGEQVWIDNVAPVTIASQVCISQSVYLCTGNHNWAHPQFELVLGEIQIEQGAWIAARATVGPGVTVGVGAVLCLGSTAGKPLAPMLIYGGNPAQPMKERRLDS